MRRSTWIGAAAATTIAAVAVTLAVVWPGYDAQQTPLDDPTVWALQNGAGSGYARVNLDLGEVDTVKQVENGTQLAQTADRLFVYSDGGSSFSDVDLAAPADLTSEADDLFTPTPPGTIEILSAGDAIVYRTEGGGVFGATLSGGGAAAPIDPYAGVERDADAPRFAASAVAVDAEGIVYAYSAAESVVVRADAATGRILGQDDTPISPADAQLTAVSGTWVLYDVATGEVAVRGRDDLITTDPVSAPTLQRAATAGTDAYIADPTGLTRVPLESGPAERVLDDPALGIPAAPVPAGTDVHAAWLRDGSSGGTLWSSGRPGDRVELDYAGADIGDSADPVFIGNGSRTALNDRSSGWVWEVPSGTLVPSSQQWRIEDTTEAEQESEETSERVLDPKPPVAVDDAFGVRAGSVALLPVLLNDHDPNEDVLSIDPASLEGLDPAFGTASITGAEQQVAVTVAPDATGSTTFRYRVTDGTADGGLFSETATVTLRVVPEDENTAPVWCGVDGCLETWPSLSVAPGGTVTADLLKGWVDPDGDPLYLSGIEAPPAVGSATTSPEGEFTYQHPDPSATEGADVQIGIVVADAFGASTTQPLSIEITPAPELRAESFAVTGVVGEPVDVSIAPYVTGASGPPALSSVVSLDTSRTTATPNPSALGLTFTASEAGSYVVQYSVRDRVGEASALVRVTVRDPQDVTVSTPPLTAFVRPSEDATIDVASAAANPAGLVLLLEDIRPDSDPTASLSVDLVGQSLLRVSGSTDDGGPGRLGVVRYRLTDGRDDDAIGATGELTVILLPAGSAEPPIAVDDAVTVRAGAQVDIPVLENDRAPAGAQIAIDPSSVVNETGGGLAFASGRLLRYLAPRTAGTYALTYTVSRLGFPEVVDTARVTVTVTAGDENRAPVPRTLVGRVVAGQAVTIPFDAFAVDPDGDEVTLDAITQQPAEGAAAISADGRSIVYTSREGSSGQVRFAYQVRDARGETGRADVRVGVIDRQSDPSPVTFSDYVQVQAGEGSEVIVRPADNDLDPFDSPLEVADITPNAPAGSPEFDALTERIVRNTGGAVTIAAGTALGTFSYSYTVVNADGDSAIGLVVVKVVRDPVPDHPVVRDTVLTLEDRDRFPGGVDVLSGMVSWSGGDPSALRLSLWGSPDDLTVDGWEISGDLPERSRLIPFEVTGTAFDGAEVTSYGFLRVPGTADLRLSLRAGLPPLQVAENASVDLDLSDAVVLPDGERLLLDAGSVKAGGARAEADCSVVSGTRIRYSAGRGAPWSDSCIVGARLTGQEQATFLAIRVEVEAETPQPTLRSASLGVRPGETQTYDLGRMVRWAGVADDAALRFAADYSGDQFEVVAEGDRLTVTAADDARPGREEQVVVSLPSHPETPSAAVVLTVGPSPSTLPRGGSATRTCSQSDGSTSCTIEVIGAAGEVNPLPGTALRVVAASSAGNCDGVRFSPAGERAVRASWSSDAEGAARCIGSFVVEDAQGRQSSGDRNGSVTLDLRGLPADPTRVEWTAYGPDSVTLRVVSDAGSYPGVDRYRITTGGREVASCAASGVCGPIDAPVGEKRVYEARAVNEVGASRGTVRTEAWAYRSPAQPTGSRFDPVPNGNDGGVATVTITGLDDTTGSVRLSGGVAGSATQSVSGGTATFAGYAIGANDPTTLIATPLTEFDLPPIAGGSSEGGELRLEAHGVGAPRIELSQTTTSDSMTVTVRVLSQSAGTQMLFGYSERSAAQCTPDTTQSSRTFPAETFRSKTIHVCATSTFRGAAGFGTAAAEITARPTGSVGAPQEMTYTVEPRPSGDQSSGFTYGISRRPDAGRPPFEDARLRYFLNGTPQDAFEPRLNQPGDRWTAAWCDTFLGVDGRCSDATPINPAANSADYPIFVSTADVPSCRSDAAAPDWRPAGFGADVATVEKSVRSSALGPERVTYTVDWIGALDGLDEVSVSVDCEQIAPPPPDPEPTPTPTETPVG
ncbi:cadherin-like domain-containing protein [Microbacterium sp. EYE_5]|uniref:Ig-like domain-containing protein n=1 Tax=unclassified Microbacterium TaxID=2609290 RepID=UPI002002F283|nr:MULTISPECIES: Ig-like domain-containing protein [unclassified Microbacterium]MCK6081167.1 cadherin-like domain-containing protein [Microbacterium sp. EYE_382]MCK6086437.1 cadherin-like domain-containing protein [Microbacterium sp. EYE_384]MCK6124065.1 cadherin-like domain-containing protein [Microbacterium sp. EYE_80]MCK6126974.1 cadherin-like domain-containing protein [Microbacterium sp. EYE_79]MCK6142122.1 cadherin-like domain-containing protein [Microbacterium sp. EYE_39]